MWGNKAESSTSEDSAQANGQEPAAGAQGEDEVIAFVGKGVEFKGVISYDGTVRIDGHLDGEIHTEGILLVGEDAVITAKVTAGTIVCKGKITGDIIAKEKVKLLAPGMLNGSVNTPVLSMEEGVLFNGSCEMSRVQLRELPREMRDMRDVRDQRESRDQREQRESMVRAVNVPTATMKRIPG